VEDLQGSLCPLSTASAVDAVPVEQSGFQGHAHPSKSLCFPQELSVLEVRQPLLCPRGPPQQEEAKPLVVDCTDVAALVRRATLSLMCPSSKAQSMMPWCYQLGYHKQDAVLLQQAMSIQDHGS
jgi:hypothetical protein